MGVAVFVLLLRTGSMVYRIKPAGVAHRTSKQNDRPHQIFTPWLYISSCTRAPCFWPRKWFRLLIFPKALAKILACNAAFRFNLQPHSISYASLTPPPKISHTVLAVSSTCSCCCSAIQRNHHQYMYTRTVHKLLHTFAFVFYISQYMYIIAILYAYYMYHLYAEADLFQSSFFASQPLSGHSFRLVLV